MPKCRICKQPLPDYARFCGQCGEPVDASMPVTGFAQKFRKFARHVGLIRKSSIQNGYSERTSGNLGKAPVTASPYQFSTIDRVFRNIPLVTGLAPDYDVQFSDLTKLEAWWLSFSKRHTYPLYGIILATSHDTEAALFAEKYIGELDQISGKNGCFVYFRSLNKSKQLIPFSMQEHSGGSIALAKLLNISLGQFPCILFFQKIGSGDYVHISLANLSHQTINELIRQIFDYLNEISSPSPLAQLKRFKGMQSMQVTSWNVTRSTLESNLIYNTLMSTEEVRKVTEPAVSSRTKVFMAYSHKDVNWLERLQVHFKPLEHRGMIEIWDDSKIKAGTKWKEELQAAIQSSVIAVLIVSADFLASDFLTEYELPKLLSHAEAKGTTIMPVIVSPCLLKGSGIEVFQAINPPSKPLSKMKRSTQDETLVKLVEAVNQKLTQV